MLGEEVSQSLSEIRVLLNHRIAIHSLPLVLRFENLCTHVIEHPNNTGRVRVWFQLSRRRCCPELLPSQIGDWPPEHLP